MNKNPRWTTITHIPRRMGMVCIKIYQATLSPDHGPFRKNFPNGYCRFYPSCSMYAYNAIEKHGLLIGTALGSYRILRCNPWNKGGIDEVPDHLHLTR